MASINVTTLCSLEYNVTLFIHKLKRDIYFSSETIVRKKCTFWILECKILSFKKIPISLTKLRKKTKIKERKWNRVKRENFVTIISVLDRQVWITSLIFKNKSTKLTWQKKPNVNESIKSGKILIRKGDKNQKSKKENGIMLRGKTLLVIPLYFQ